MFQPSFATNRDSGGGGMQIVRQCTERDGNLPLFVRADVADAAMPPCRKLRPERLRVLGIKRNDEALRLGLVGGLKRMKLG